VRRAVDTNVLVYAHIASFPEHPAAKRHLEAFLAEPDSSLVVVPLVLHELVQVITDGRRFEEPVSMPEAIAVARLYLNRSNVQCVEIGAESVGRALALLETHQLGRKRIADALLAATLLEHGVFELITNNEAHFQVFEEITCVNPLREGRR
jgi:toxin-antitoxin system PIN domain toxin